MSAPSSAEQLAAVTQQVDGADDVCLLWQCRHLRTADQPAIEYATERYGTILPVFIVDPAFYGKDGLACDARIRFLCESLADLTDQYESLGGGLTMLHGDPAELLSELGQHIAHIVTTADPTGRYGLRRDNAVAEACEITFVDADGLRRDVPNPRENWSEHVESYLTAPVHEVDAEQTRIEHVDTGIDPAWIEAYYDITPTKQISRVGGTEHGRALLDEFIENLSEYPGNISAPADARTGTSQLSPYLRFGCLSIRQVYKAVVDAPGRAHATEMFTSRLYWNRHYNQKLADWSGWMDRAVNPVLEGFHEETYDPERVEAWKKGLTGYPMVDASMRCLRQTGWLNFRMRAMCASVLCDLLQQPWQIGADFFYYHLLDADPAINYRPASTAPTCCGYTIPESRCATTTRTASLSRPGCRNSTRCRSRIWINPRKHRFTSKRMSVYRSARRTRTRSSNTRRPERRSSRRSKPSGSRRKTHCNTPKYTGAHRSPGAAAQRSQPRRLRSRT